MTHSGVPQRIERLLYQLGAEPKFRDDVIGDLAEEFELRARLYGVDAARRWYCREAARTAPHLLRNWWQGRRVADAGELFGIGLWAICVLMAFQFVAYPLEVVLLTGFPALAPLITSPLGIVGQVAMLMIVAAGAGYVTSSLGRGEPGPTTVIACLACTGFAAALAAIAAARSHSVPYPVFVGVWHRRRVEWHAAGCIVRMWHIAKGPAYTALSRP